MHHPTSAIDFDRLPRFPAAICRALRHVRDSEVSPEDLERLLGIEEDVAGELVKAANLPIFGARSTVRSLSHAVACLGRDGFHDLLFTAAALSLFREGLPALDANALRAHSLACGLLARELSKRLRVAEATLAYRAGLVHDIGLVAAGAGLREASWRAAARAADGKLALVCAERTMMGQDHTSLGQQYGERLDLEPSLIPAIRFHHAPDRAGSGRGLAALVGFSDRLCRAAGVGYGFPEDLEGEDLARHPSWSVLCAERRELAGLDPHAVAAETMEKIPDVREAVLEMSQEPVPA